MNRFAIAAIGVGIGLVAVATTASGHDYWLVPARTSAPKHTPIDVRLYRGEALEPEDERPLEVEKTARFRLLAGGRDQDLLGSAVDGRSPVARVTPEVEGGHLVVMERKPQPIRLDAAKFTEYLKEEGLDAVIRRREELGESKAEGRESYSRYLKALIQVGGAHDDTYKQPAGLLLEILPEADPAARKPGDTLPFRVVFEGRPLAGAQVTAHVDEGGKIRGQTLTTDAEGRAEVRIDRAGTWLIRLVHMRRAAGNPDADWESFWGAYTFGL